MNLRPEKERNFLILIDQLFPLRIRQKGVVILAQDLVQITATAISGTFSLICFISAHQCVTTVQSFLSDFNGL